MDRILKELFGGDDEPAAPAASPTTDPATTAARPVDPDRDARREARQQRKADPDRRRKRDEFVDRYTTGDPSEGFTTQEAIAHLREMRDELSPAEFRAAMQQTLENLPPSQRDDFIAIMRQYKSGQPGAGAAATTGAGTTAPAASGDPFGGLLTGLMGSGAAGAGSVGIGDLLDDLQKGGTRAPSATPGEQPTEEDFRALLESPLGRAVLGGVAAYGMQGMRGDDDDDVDYGTRTRGG